MNVRHVCAQAFYPDASPDAIAACIAGFAPPAMAAPPRGAVVPHAGWFFSGRTAARVFRTLQAALPQTRSFVFLGAVHRAGLTCPAMDGAEAWETPLGTVPVDGDLARAILDADAGVVRDARAHAGEHSIEVSLPFIRHFFPGARVVPIACPPFPGAAAFGRALGPLLAPHDAIVVASTDLTHYGEGYGWAPAGTQARQALEFLRANDQRIIDRVLALDADAIVPEAALHMNACGAGALAAAAAAAKAMGAARGVLIEYRTSHDALPAEPCLRAVGYAGMVMV